MSKPAKSSQNTSKFILIALVFVFVLFSVGGMLLISVKNLRGIFSSGKSGAGTSPAGSTTFEELVNPEGSWLERLSEEQRAFLDSDYTLLSDGDGNVVAVFSKVISIDSANRIANLEIFEEDFDLISEDDSFEDGVYGLEIANNGDIFKYDSANGVEESLEFSDISIGDIVGFYFDEGVVFVKKK